MATTQKPNIFQRIAHWFQQIFQETVGELRKVSWPTFDEARRLSVIVVIVLVVMSTMMWILDLLYSFFFKWILQI